MKKVISILLLMLSLTANAQSDDWTSFIKKNFPQTYSVIAQEAKIEWNGDYEMQAYKIKKQCNNFYTYISWVTEKPNIPQEVWQEIATKAFAEWSKNKYPNMNKCTSANDLEKLDCRYAEMNSDWEMVIYTIKKQIEAYLSLK